MSWVISLASAELVPCHGLHDDIPIAPGDQSELLEHATRIVWGPSSDDET